MPELFDGLEAMAQCGGLDPELATILHGKLCSDRRAFHTEDVTATTERAVGRIPTHARLDSFAVPN